MPRRVKKRFGKRQGNRGGLSKKQIAQVKSYIKGSMETKLRRLVIAQVAVTNVAQTHFLNGVQQGTDQGNRIGRQCRFFHWNGRFTLLIGDTTNFVRIIMVQDRQTNGVTPTYGEIFNQTDHNAVQQIQNRARFLIHYDRTYSMVTGGSNEAITVVINKRLRLPKSWYDGATNTIGDMQKNGLFMFVVSDSAAVVHPTIEGVSELLFKDD